jgi:hypothetical protein
MDRKEARTVLIGELSRYRAQEHRALQRLLTSQDTYEVRGPSGSTYQIEIQAVWDDQPGGNLRVMGSIDDGGLRAFVPLNEDFIITPTGAFLGE